MIFRTNSFVSDGFILSYFTIETNGNFLKYPIHSGGSEGLVDDPFHGAASGPSGPVLLLAQGGEEDDHPFQSRLPFVLPPAAEEEIAGHPEFIGDPGDDGQRRHPAAPFIHPQCAGGQIQSRAQLGLGQPGLTAQDRQSNSEHNAHILAFFLYHSTAFSRNPSNPVDSRR